MKTYALAMLLSAASGTHAATVSNAEQNSSPLGWLLISIAVFLLFTLLLKRPLTKFYRQLRDQAFRLQIDKTVKAFGLQQIENALLPGVYGGLTKIDHIVQTPAGILCVRRRHLNGVVHADEAEPQWLNTYRSRQSRVMNPLLQNSGRIRALQNLIPESKIHNIVLLTGNACIHNKPQSNVLHLRELHNFLEQLAKDNNACEQENYLEALSSHLLNDAAAWRSFESQLSFS